MSTEYPVMDISCVAFADQREAVEHLKSLIRTGAHGYTVAINAEKIMRCRRDLPFRELVSNALVKVPDGAGAVLALRILSGVRSAKIDFPQSTFIAANELGAGCRLGIIGASDDSHRAAVEEVRRRYPDARIVMNRSGFTPEDQLLAELKEVRPQLCLLSMGTPKQENFAQRAVAAGVPCIFVGAGGALDILSGHAVRAPKWMVDNYLEWLYRLIQNPSRWRRQLVLPVFIGQLILERLRAGRHPSRAVR
jgi:N-acetylglucosaminyldiphosphoundecaprenol N-acetyl-beta-D-mannosaminyltransferase